MAPPRLELDPPGYEPSMVTLPPRRDPECYQSESVRLVLSVGCSAMTWWHNRMAAFDLETTSPDPEEARIVSATVAYVSGGLGTSTKSWLVNPEIEIPQEATEVHGITTEQAHAEGMNAREAVDEIFTQIFLAAREGMALVIFNAPYDLTVLDRELRRHDLGEWWLPKKCIVDPRVIDAHLHRYRPGSRKLAATCEHYGVKLEGAHDASFDAVAAARLAWVMGKRGQLIRRKPHSRAEAEETHRLREEWERVRNDLPALYAAQITWALGQQLRLEEYFHEGNAVKDVPPQPERSVPRGWPLLPRRDPKVQQLA